MTVVRRSVTSFAIAVSLCAAISAQTPFVEESALKTRLREAIFRYMFSTYRYGGDVKTYYIQPELPQADKFLRRFADSKVRVVWASDCNLSGPMNAAREKKTGGRALIMSLESLYWTSGNEADAKVEAFSDGIAANWNTLHLVLNNRQWVVISDKVDDIS